jgi:hypothetical protein
MSSQPFDDENENETAVRQRMTAVRQRMGGGGLLGFIRGLIEAQTNPDYEPRSVLGKFIKAMIDRGNGNRNETRDDSAVSIDENPRAGEPQTVIGFTNVGTPPPELVAPNAPAEPVPAAVNSPTAADAAIAAMANGTATREQIQTFEEASIQRLKGRQARTGDANISRALGVMQADGQISQNEYKVYQAIIEKSGIDLSGIGVSSAKDIDTIPELGKAIAAMGQQQAQVVAQR